MIDHALARAEQLLMDKKALFLGFIALMLFLFVFNAFPSLYGDEYGSLFDAFHLAGNIHAIGYFSQLRLWSFLWQEDWFLRLLSLLWFGAGLYWLVRWLETEKIPGSTRVLLAWLVMLNPFLWIYGFQVRFYAMFFATSILFVWRFRTWQTHSSGRNLFLLLISVMLLLVSHLFGLLVIGVTLLNSIWEKLPSRKKWWLVAALALGTTLLFYPPTAARTKRPFPILSMGVKFPRRPLVDHGRKLA